MTKARKTTTRMIVCLMVCILAVMACVPALAQGNTRRVNGRVWPVYWRNTGNGEEISIFQVAVTKAPATISFAQEEGLCYEASYTHYFDGKDGLEEEWGKYHVYYRLKDGGRVSCKDWDKTRKGGKFDLYLNQTGVYYVWVVPYTAQEMTDSWTLDTFKSWNRTPRWWIEGTSNETRIVCIAGEMNLIGNPKTDKPLYIENIIPES